MDLNIHLPEDDAMGPLTATAKAPGVSVEVRIDNLAALQHAITGLEKLAARLKDYLPAPAPATK